MNRSRSFLFTLVASCGLAIGLGAALVPSNAFAQASSRTADDRLPVKRITLYRSGVGYFERHGAAGPGSSGIQLRFKTEQINDILKSMVVLIKPDTGRLESVSYGSKEPLERRLASFGVNIADNPSMPVLLERLRGENVSVKSQDGDIAGTILGVEQRKISQSKEQAPFETPFLNLVTAAGLKSVPVSAITAFQLTDEALAAELSKALAALAEYRADTTKTVDLTFSGADSMPVTVAYIHEMPVWKTSYRLVLADESGAKESTAQVQGWAIVENTTDEDWNQVQLGLVSGRPVSFQMDLYEPLYMDRPELPVSTVPGAVPRAYAAGVDDGLARLVREPSSPAPMPAITAGAPGGLRADRGFSKAESTDIDAGFGVAMDLAFSAENMAEYAAAGQASASEVGEVFQFQVDAPITIERQRSAMIPIINSGVDSRRVSIYSARDGGSHPMRGVEITNTSDLQMLPGPISVYDGAAYAGDAEIGHVSPGDKRLLSYAIDLDVAVLTEPSNEETMTSLKIVNGLFEQTIRRRLQAVYGFQNNDEKRARTILIEHPAHDGWTLVEPTKPTERTESVYRLTLDLAPSAKGAITVREEQVVQQQIGITSFDLPTVIQFQNAGTASAALVDAIRQVAARQAEMSKVEQSIADLDRQIGVISQDQNRIRENMKSIAQNSDLYARYIQKLSEQETQLEGINTRRADAVSRLETLRNEFNAFVAALNVE